MLRRFALWVRVRAAKARFRAVRQHDQTDCGPASLLTVLRYYGGNSSLARIRWLAKTTAEGATMLSLLHTARELGFEANGARGSYDDLRGERLPCIAHVVEEERRHFFVVLCMTSKYVSVSDPAKGIRVLSRAAFEDLWVSNAVLLLETTDELADETVVGWLPWLNGFFRGESVWLTQVLFLGVVQTAAGLGLAVAIQQLVDRIIPAGDGGALIVTAVALLVLQLLSAGAGLQRQRFAAELSRRVNCAMTGDVIERVFKLPLLLFEARKTGDFTSRLQDALRIQATTVAVLSEGLVDILTLGATVTLLFYFAPPIGWLVLGTGPVLFLAMVLMAGGVKELYRTVMAGYAHAESAFIDSLNGMPEIVGYGRRDTFQTSNSLAFTEYQLALKNLSLRNAHIGAGVEATTGLLLSLVLVFLAGLVIDGGIQLGAMMASFSLVARALPSAARLGQIAVVVQGARVAAERVIDLTELVSTIEFSHTSARTQLAASAQEAKLQVSVDGLSIHAGSFAWPSGHTVIENADLTLPRNRMTALWGRSGSGKSTVLKLLAGLYPLQRGELRLDGQAVDRIDAALYAARVALVPENVKIFSASLFENITLGRPVPDISWVMQRLETIRWTSWAPELGANLGQRVGEQGRTLSSGETQLVGLARALLFDPDILLLDESLDSIDLDRRGQILEFLRSRLRNKSMLLISHDLSTLDTADDVWILADGQCAMSSLDNVRLEHARQST